MTLRPPHFWYRDAGAPPPLTEILTAALCPLYRAGAAINAALKGPAVRVGAPVICIGNLNAGGAGKTPAALAVMDLIRRNNLARNPFFLTRGYGGALRGPVQADPALHGFHDVGDEALLLANAAPVIVARDRAAGAQYAVAAGADLIVMDDGFQNRALHQDLKIIVIDGMTGFGNGRTLPAGPLREPLADGLARADAFILIGDDARGVAALLPPSKPLIRARIMVDEAAAPPRDRRYVAFAGIGHPAKFFKALRDNGYDVAAEIPFPDHHPYTADDAEKLTRAARDTGADLITTAKDHVRLTALPIRTTILPMKLAFEREGLKILLKGAKMQ